MGFGFWVELCQKTLILPDVARRLRARHRRAGGGRPAPETRNQRPDFTGMVQGFTAKISRPLLLLGKLSGTAVAMNKQEQKAEITDARAAG
jgi:hypothetical protein